MTRWITATITAACLSLAASVTINVYFPAAAAEKAADRIIEDVWGKDKEQPAKDGGQSSLLPTGGGERRVLLAAAGSLLDLVIPRAEAQADLDISRQRSARRPPRWNRATHSSSRITPRVPSGSRPTGSWSCVTRTQCRCPSGRWCASC